ncbi:hypothetical protein HUJ04_013037 [Dendroctonus ponderosae]|uniref:Fanconi anemia group M protein n=2 Tax=Dendroctonus ponderosae TaxID=77166 RepID=A0AAR5P208_DENPD|nr:hypothetical protein HUJ04_013037 [Dendroctonus ponderosae]
MEMQSQSIALSKSVESEGFDLQAGQTWTYPTNYPIRDYQHNITSAALHKNTLVSLPTGLGKTFIAAVVMYNFYRWYPQGKIIFMAPTKPLVKQQIEACYNIMAIPAGVTAELTGTKASLSRANIWLEKRVFFVTPQVLQNDLDKVAQLGKSIKCLVFDEAHKARGNHAYCQVIAKLLKNGHKYFRVLALSATPGGNINDVAEVVNNLLISHLEFRTEESVDVHPYVFQRSLETVVVHLDEKLLEIKEEYMKIVEYYARTLIQHNIIQGNCGWLTKGKIFMLMKDFQSKNKGHSTSNYSEIMRCLNICVTLYHALELLIRHGLRNFLSFFDEHIEKPLLRGNTNLRLILEQVRAYLGPIPQMQLLPDGTYPAIPSDIKFGHPKHYKLRDLLTKHFRNETTGNSRVMVFFEYRESVMEAHTLLLQSRPLIQPRVFLGQGSGVTQKTQLGVVRDFKEGRCNTLLSTCIGEEGLDIGEVDLIVCFDISNKSPIRMVQRMGRTGRKREGSVLVLVTEGKEQQTLKDCLIHKNNISTHVLGSSYLRNNLYPDNPSLIPADLVPRCEKIFITVKEKPSKNSLLDKLKQHSSRAIVFSQDSVSCSSSHQDLITETPMRSTFSGNPLEVPTHAPLFSRHIESMRTPQKACLIGHSENALLLSDLLSFADAKRFNIPTKTQGKSDEDPGKSLKQGDIRRMFLQEKRPASVEDFEKEISSISTETLLISQREPKTFPIDDICRSISNYLYEELTRSTPNCVFCPKGFDCSNFVVTNPSATFSQTIIIPNEEIIQQIDLQSIEDYMAIIDGNSYAQQLVDDDLDTLSQFEEQCEPMHEPPKEQFHTFEAPKGFLRLMDTLIEDEEAISDEHLLEFFMLQSYQEVFHQSSPVEIENCAIADMCDLSYYGLSEQDIRDFEAKTQQITSSSNEVANDGITCCVNPEKNEKWHLESTLFKNNASLITHEFYDEDATPPDIVAPPEETTGNVSITQLVNILNKTQTTSSNRNHTLNGSAPRFFGDSDDDFEESILCNRSRFHGQKQQKSTSQKENVKIATSTKVRKHANKAKDGNEFLDLEAEVSNEDSVFISDDEEEISDGYEISFVNDKSQLFNTEIHGMYLRSVKSPRHRHRKPLLEQKPMRLSQIYSQMPPEEPDDYLEDSFCVDVDDEELTQINQLSQLSVLEKKLQIKRKNKACHSTEPQKPKRRRIKCLSSDSD